MNDPMNLTGRTLGVTGGASAIAGPASRHLASPGATVMAVDRHVAVEATRDGFLSAGGGQADSITVTGADVQAKARARQAFASTPLAGVTAKRRCQPNGARPTPLS